MKIKNSQKFIVLLSLSFILLGFNFVSAEGEEPDLTVPEIKLIGNPITTITVGQTYVDDGATAFDNIDGDITSSIIKTGTVDSDTVGTYTINYDVDDKAGNHAIQISRQIIVNEAKENFIIRNGEDIIWQGEKILPANDNVIIDGKSVSSRSILAILESIDVESDKFSISNLLYYTSYGGAFYLKCITLASGTELCDNWQYAVGTVSPWTSIDTTILSGGETVGIYFGTSHRVVVNDDSVYSGDSISVVSEKYDYENNVWNPLDGVSIGVTLPNKDDQWNPIVVNTYPVDENGVADIVIENPDTYTIGIVEDYYIPSYKVVVSKRSSGGSSSGSTIITDNLVDENNFSLSNAISFLSNNFGSEKFNELLYTDWVAIGLSQSGSESDSLKNAISGYLKNNDLKSSVITDNERHAMALMSLGIDPFVGTNINYIKKIIDSFDGSQIGDKNLINDDIFGLIVLSHVGYDKKDEIISKMISFVLSKQDSSGSWGSVDMTSASIQALNNFKNFSGVKDSISKGELFLLSEQQSNGSFGNSFSTSWAIQALSLNNNFSDAVNKAIKYIVGEQQTDGGLENNYPIESRVWATSYAIPAVAKLSWNDIIESFSVPEKEETENMSLETEKDIIPEVELKPELITVPKNETVNEGKEKIIKAEIIKKDKVSKEKIHPKFVLMNNKSNNLIASNNIELNQNDQNNNILSNNYFHRVLRRLVTPFIWLWSKINYLL